MSQWPEGRGTPRWSVAAQPIEPPALIAGLPGRSARVSVGPPLSARGARRGLVLGRSLGSLNGQDRSPARLWPCERKMTTPSLLQSALPVALVLPATIVFRSETLCARGSP